MIGLHFPANTNPAVAKYVSAISNDENVLKIRKDDYRMVMIVRRRLGGLAELIRNGDSCN